MAYFEWADDMVIDNGVIDQEHRVLVDLVNELHTATSRGMGQTVVASILRRAIDSTREHLTHEEDIMAREGFPDLEEHKLRHQEFMNSLYDLERRLQTGGITVAAQLSRVLRDWLSLHIRRGDKELRRFVQRREREQERAKLQAKIQGRTQAAGQIGMQAGKNGAGRLPGR